MRIHTDHLRTSDIYSAALLARVDTTVTLHRSRSRARAYNVTLRGESNRRPNSGQRGADTNDYAATWDQWGVFLAVLFDADPRMITPYDGGRAHFDVRTCDRFVKHLAANRDADDGTVVNTWWPDDAHGDHSWQHDVSWNAPGERRCRKCSAVERNEYAIDRLVGAF